MKSHVVSLPLLSVFAALAIACGDDDNSPPVGPDTTPPTLVSATPTNNSTNVDVNSHLSFTFSEPVNAIAYALFELTSYQTWIGPNPGYGSTTWSNGGRTVTIVPADPLADNTQYVMTILPRDVADVAGNGIVGVHQVTFSTGSALASGSIHGTITGDAGSESADPTGAYVSVTIGNAFGGQYYIVGTARVRADDTYTIPHVADGTYYLMAMLDSSGDGRLDLSDGDAYGQYGVDHDIQDNSPNTVTVASGAPVVNADFKLRDPSAISGTVTYSGAHTNGQWALHVGVFPTTDFSGQPVGNTVGGNWPLAPSWSVLGPTIPEGMYYVGGYIDLDGNFAYDPATEPAGIYGGIASPTLLDMTNGQDYTGIVVPMFDPPLVSQR